MLFLSSLYFYLVPLLIFISTIAKLTKSCLMVFIIFFCSFFATCIQKKQISRSMKKQNMRRKTNTFVFLLLFFGQNGKKASLAKLCKKSIEFYLLSKWVYVERAFSAKCSYSFVWQRTKCSRVSITNGIFFFRYACSLFFAFMLIFIYESEMRFFRLIFRPFFLTKLFCSISFPMVQVRFLISLFWLFSLYRHLFKCMVLKQVIRFSTPNNEIRIKTWIYGL